jgi:hypothetical protein
MIGEDAEHDVAHLVGREIVAVRRHRAPILAAAHWLILSKMGAKTSAL